MKCISGIFYEKPKPWCPVSPAFPETAGNPGELTLLTTSLQRDYPSGCCCSDRVSDPWEYAVTVKVSNWPLQWWMVKGSQKMVPLLMVSWMLSLSRTFFDPNAQRDVASEQLWWCGCLKQEQEREEMCLWFQNKETWFPFPSQLPHLYFNKLGGVTWISKENCYLLLLFPLLRLPFISLLFFYSFNRFAMRW